MAGASPMISLVTATVAPRARSGPARATRAGNRPVFLFETSWHRPCLWGARRAAAMNRVSAFVYGVVAYVIFFATFLYAAGFIGNLVVPKTLDGAPVGPLGTSLLIDLGVLALFAVQHSVMARPAF